MTQVTFEDSIVKMRHFGSFSHTMRTRVNMAGIRPQPQEHKRRPMPFFTSRYTSSKMGKK